MENPSHAHASHTSAVFAGALAHLASYVEYGCRRSGSLAAMLFEQIAADTMTEECLRIQAVQWADRLNDADTRHPSDHRQHPGIRSGKPGPAERRAGK